MPVILFDMRVAIDGRPLASPLTGIGHYTLELARSLANVAHDDDFTTVSPVPLLPAVADELNLSRRPNLHSSELNSERLNRYWWTVGLPFFLGRSSFNLFHGTNYDIPRWGRIPSIATIHDLSLLLHPETHQSRLVARAGRRFPAIARRASHIITGSESVKREIVEHLKVSDDKVTVTPYAHRSCFRPLPQRETVEVGKRLGIEGEFILFVGTIEPRKNLQTLVKAFDQILATTDLSPQLVIAGPKGWLLDSFAAEQSNRKSRIHFTGYLPDVELAALYSSCAAFVYPSLYEGFGLPPLEAMACGAPVITSDIPVLRETVGNAACLIDPLSVDGLAHAVSRVLTDPNFSDELRRAGLAQSSRFSWTQTARQTLDVYKQVLG